MNNTTYKALRFAVLGGDLRQMHMASGLSKSGCSVKLYGFDGYSDSADGVSMCNDLKNALTDCNYVVLPEIGPLRRQNLIYGHSLRSFYIFLISIPSPRLKDNLYLISKCFISPITNLSP